MTLKKVGSSDTPKEVPKPLPAKHHPSKATSKLSSSKPLPSKPTPNDKYFMEEMDVSIGGTKGLWATSPLTEEVKTVMKSELKKIKGSAGYKADSDVAVIILNQKEHPDNGWIYITFYQGQLNNYPVPMRLSDGERAAIRGMLQEKYGGKYRVLVEGVYNWEVTRFRLEPIITQ